MAPIANQVFDWALIRSHCAHFHIFQSDNDPYIPKAKAEELARNLQSNVTWIPGAGHFNTAAGCTRFPLLLTAIEGV